jgi:phosphoglycolate phosphatase
LSDSPPPPRAILFDLDGTLVDSRRDIAEALGDALVAHGRERLPLERVLPLIGDGPRLLVQRALGAPHDDALVSVVLATFRARYRERPCTHTTLLPGAREAIAAAPLAAVVTNKQRDVSVLVLEALGIAARFGAVWGGDDGPMKPAPDGVLAVLAKLGVAPREAWMVGDGPQDVGAGRAAGCFTVAVPGIAERDRVLAAEPDLVVESLHDVARLCRARP